MQDKLMTLDEVAEQLFCSRRHVENLVASGQLRSVKLGGLRRVRESALEAYISEREDGGKKVHEGRWVSRSKYGVKKPKTA